MNRRTAIASLGVFIAACAGQGAASTETRGPTIALPSSPTTIRPPSTAPPISPTTIPDATTATVDWTLDMAALSEGVRRIHPDPFWRQPESEFDAWLTDAPARLATMTEDDAKAEVMRLVAQIDGHTGVYPSEVGFHLYELHLYKFGDDIDIVNAPDPDLIGARIISINGTPTAAAIAAVTPYSAHDNASTIEVVVPMLLTTPEVLHAAGIVDDTAAPQFVVRRLDGLEQALNPDRLTWDDYATMLDWSPVGLPKLARLASVARVDEPFWTTTSADGKVIYLQYNQVVRSYGRKTLQSLADDIASELSAHPGARLIIDLRNNPGGDNTTYGPLLRLLTTNAALAEPQALVLIVGRQTFSAAMNFATEVERNTSAVFVGEPTGGRPNLYGDVRPLALPKSHILVEVSSIYWDFGGPDDVRDSIVPDVAVSLTLDDLIAGRDPVLEAAVNLGG